MNPDIPIIVFSPVLLDLNVKSPLGKMEYYRFLNDMLVNEGDWVEIPDFDKFISIVEEIAQKPFQEVLSNNCDLGATILASVAAFNDLYDFDYKIVLFAGENSLQINTIYFDLFKDKFSEFEVKKYKGNSYICLISFTSEIPERTMFLHKGLDMEVPEDFDLYSNSLILISAFEIAAGFFKFNWANLHIKNIFFAINLGDKDVLNQRTIDTIISLASNNLLKYLFGSIGEFSVLTSVGIGAGTEMVFSFVRELSITCSTVFFITSDAGVQIFHGGNFYFEPSVLVTGIVNTNGAGDAAAGGFMSSHIKTSDFDYSLKFSLTQVEKVLKTSSGLI